jgi:hypothetical protein
MDLGAMGVFSLFPTGVYVCDRARTEALSC